MKKTLYSIIVLFCVPIIFNSCATDRSIAQRIAEFESATADEQPCFVQKNDGTIQYYSTLKLVKGIFTTPHLLADGEIKISAGEIKAYQDKDHYAVSQKVFLSGKTSRVSDETLPGFGIRLIKGKLNVYNKKFYNGERAVNEYYLQSGDEGEIKLYTPELMKELVKTDAAAYDYFNNKNLKTTLPEKMLATVELFNTGQLISKN